MKNIVDDLGALPPLNLGYIRYSTDAQDFEVQREAALRSAHGHSLDNLELMEEAAVSRTVPFFQREIGGLLLKKVEAAHAQGREINLVFPKVDRFGEGVVDISLSTEKLHALGARLIFIDLGVDTRTVLGEAMMLISAVFSRIEIRRLRERTRESMATKRRAGELCGSLTYGWNVEYTFTDGHKRLLADRPLTRSELAAACKDHGPLLSQMTLANHEEQRWIRHMDAMHRGSSPLAAIARDLNFRKVPTKMGVQRLKLRCRASEPGAVKSGKGWIIEKDSKGEWQVGNVEHVLTNATVKRFLAGE